MEHGAFIRGLVVLVMLLEILAPLGAIPTILDGVLSPTRQPLSNLGPLVPIYLMGFD